RGAQYPLDGVVAVAELVPFGLVGLGPPLEISRAASEEVPAPHFRRPAKLEAAPGVRQRGAHETGRVALAIDFDVDTIDPVAAPRDTRKEDANSGADPFFQTGEHRLHPHPRHRVARRRAVFLRLQLACERALYCLH